MTVTAKDEIGSLWMAHGSPALPMTLGDALRARANSMGEAAAYRISLTSSPDELIEYTFLDVLTDAELTAKALLARFEIGERVAVWAPNVREWISLYFGSALAGVVLVPLNPQFTESEVSSIMTDSECAGLFFVPEYRGHNLAEAARAMQRDLTGLRVVESTDDLPRFCERVSTDPLPVVTPQTIGLLQYTSGTTGGPKGVLLSHEALTHASLRSSERLGVKAGDVFLSPFPFFHVGGTVGAIGVCLMTGATLMTRQSFEAQAYLDLIAGDVTVAAGVPTIWNTLIERSAGGNWSAPHLRAIGTGAAMVPASIVEHFDSLNVSVSIVYGQTEASAITRTTRTDDFIARSSSVGRPVDGLDVKIVEIEGTNIVPWGTPGELCVRGPSVMSGYLGKPELTASVLDDEGWLRTGDIATMDTEGYCRIVNRKKELIIRGGENIYPGEIEEVIASYPGVLEVAVIGRPDEKFGEQPVAIVVREEFGDVGEEELRDYALSKLASYKVPRSWTFVDGLPRNSLGKVQKHLL